MSPIRLDADSLQVTSFVADPSLAVSGSDTVAAGVLANTEYPICIVYVSDCVSCPPDPQVAY